MAEYRDPHEQRRFDDDDFWRLPKKPAAEPSPREEREIDLPVLGEKTDAAESSAFAIPERKNAPCSSSSAGQKFPNVFIRQSYAGRGGRKSSSPRTAMGTPAEADLLVAYEPDNVLIRKVSVYRWPNQYHFYEKFIHNAHLSHAAVGHESPRVPYFSFIPQYSQLTRGQAHFYFWFRDNAREGRYLDADISYVLLYVYEIINLPDLIPPETGAALLCRLWIAYRRQHRELDKYLSEWLVDYCLIHGLSLPAEAAPLIPTAVRCSTIPEFYFSAGMTGDDLSDFTAALLAAASDYDYKTSRYYDAFREDFDTAIPAAARAAVTKMKACESGIFSPDATKTIRQSRDAFCGSLCEHNVKRRIDVELSSFARSHGLRAAVTATVKYAENRLRTAKRLKSRLAATGLPDDARLAIDAYFDAAYPGSVRTGDGTPAYEAYYDAPDVPFTPETARAIERASWEMTALLEGVREEELPRNDAPMRREEGCAADAMPTAASASAAPGDDPPPFAGEPDTAEDSFALPAGEPASEDPDARIREVLREVLAGGSLEAYCRARDLFPDETASRINEAAIDRIGDVVLETADGKWTLIEDYREDVEAWSNT